MNDIEYALEKARRGDESHAHIIYSYLSSFEKIILRGAGTFGSAFGKFLLEKKIPISRLSYWDIRASTLIEVNGIPVHEPLKEQLNIDKTLIIHCIPNGSLSGSVSEENLLTAGYQHHLSGMALFEGLMCSMKIETGFDPSICIKTTFCNWCACKRLPSLLLNECNTSLKSEISNELVFPVATFAINQKCTLQCTHCGQYINHYKADERINFPLDRIKKDIDSVFSAVDAIGYVSIIGGEPFLHPQLDAIINYVMTKKNFGVIGITTNGVCEISQSNLKTIKNGRTRIIFSDYTISLNEKQKNLFLKNVEKVANEGISYTIGQPLWNTPATLQKKAYSSERMAAIKSSCHSTSTCKTIQNGVYYPCSTTAGIGSHHMEDYPSDWVILDEASSPKDLRTKILATDRRDFYLSCNHCGDGGELLEKPGEQGIDLRYLHIGKR